MKTAYVATVLTLLAAVTVTAQEKQNELLTTAAMRKKLEYSQNILQGLATEDFELIRKNAEAMKKLGLFEAFVRFSEAQAYRTQLQVFDFSNDELIRLADEKNIDGAALAFTQSTLSCVNCHKALRAPAKAN
jgi:hypothetical protein